jgi:hypothetical protein
MLNKIESFKENDFWIKKNFFKFNKLRGMYFLFYSAFLAMFKKYFSENVKYKVLEDVNYDDYGIKSLLISKI